MSLHSILTKLNRRDTRILPEFSTFAKFLVFLFFVITSTFLITRTFAADNALQETVDGMTAGGNLESWLGKDTFRINAVGALNALIDVKTINPDLIGGKYPSNGQFFTSAPGGLIGSANTVIATLYNQPISGVEYLAEVKDNFLGKPAYAQGVGFQGLQPILPIWKAFRNIVYILSSIIFIIIGIMIMLRVKISPQAVISIQNAIPQLITSLILVTFSYAIAGLLIDLSNFILSLVLAILFSASGKSLSGNLFLPSLFSGVPVLGNILNPFNFANLSDATLIQTTQLMFIPSVVTVMLGSLISWITGVLIALPLGPAALIVGPITGAITGTVGGIIITIVLLIMIVIWIFKFLLGLFKCYATLLFKIILGPLEIGMGAFPNSKIGFNSWLTEVIANLAVFPISFLFLVISNLIIVNVIWGGFSGSIADIFSGNLTGGGMWTPSLLGGNITSFALRPIGGIAAMAIGVSTLLLLSKLPEMIPQYIFMIKPSPWGDAIGKGAQEPGMIAGRTFGAVDTFYKFRKNYYENKRAQQTVRDLPPTGNTNSSPETDIPQGNTSRPSRP